MSSKVFPWQGAGLEAGRIFTSPICPGSFVEYSRLHPKLNIHPHEALLAGQGNGCFEKLMSMAGMEAYPAKFRASPTSSPRT